MPEKEGELAGITNMVHSYGQLLGKICGDTIRCGFVGVVLDKEATKKQFRESMTIFARNEPFGTMGVDTSALVARNLAEIIEKFEKDVDEKGVPAVQALSQIKKGITTTLSNAVSVFH